MNVPLKADGIRIAEEGEIVFIIFTLARKPVATVKMSKTAFAKALEDHGLVYRELSE